MTNSTVHALPGFAALPLSEVCRLAGVSRATIYNEIQRGKLTRSKVAGRTVVLVDDFREYMEACRVPPAAATNATGAVQ